MKKIAELQIAICLRRFKIFLILILFVTCRVAEAVSIGYSSLGNIYISIYDDENYYTITPSQAGVKVITEVRYIGCSSHFENTTVAVQQIYHFQFMSPQGDFHLSIWEDDMKITIERCLHSAPRMNFNKLPYNSIDFYRSY